MDQPAQLPASQSLHRLPSSKSMHQAAIPSCRIRPSSSDFSLAFPQSATVQSLLGQTLQIRSSRTWTPSSGGLGLLSDADEVQDRAVFVQEYNRLAKKHGVRLLLVGDFDPQQGYDDIRCPEKRSWLYRLFRNSPSRPASSKSTPSPRLRHRRSVSDLGYLIHSRRGSPKTIDIQTMVRLSGKSVLYLPPDYSPCSLILPTCIRATAQHIAQNATTRGVFRIPGSVKIVNSLFDYYCYMGNGSLDVAGTVCCATLPTHIRYSVHDVGSTFKRLLSVLPGGVLGSLSLFDAFVGIHSQLHGEPEFPRTKQTKVRARLIALAIGTIESQFRRDLLCAVFGLLSLIGRVAEVSPREDADGRPLPTGDLMGYNALGIVFGPLLVGDLLGQYAMKLATPTSGLLLFPLSPKKQRRDRLREKAETNSGLEPPPVDKVMVANSITEMLITNWRDMVRQMKALGTHYRHETCPMRLKQGQVQPPASDFIIRMPQDLDEVKVGDWGHLADRDNSPEQETPTLALKRRRSRPMRKTSTSRVSAKPSNQTLSPTVEEGVAEEVPVQEKLRLTDENSQPAAANNMDINGEFPASSSQRLLSIEDTRPEQHVGHVVAEPENPQALSNMKCGGSRAFQTPNVYFDSVPPRLSSRQRRCCNGSATTSINPSSCEEQVSKRGHEEEQRSFEVPERGRRSRRANEQSLPKRQASIRSPLAGRHRCGSNTPSDALDLKNTMNLRMLQPSLRSASRESRLESLDSKSEVEPGLTTSGDSAIFSDARLLAPEMEQDTIFKGVKPASLVTGPELLPEPVIGPKLRHHHQSLSGDSNLAAQGSIDTATKPMILDSSYVLMQNGNLELASLDHKVSPMNPQDETIHSQEEVTRKPFGSPNAGEQVFPRYHVQDTSQLDSTARYSQFDRPPSRIKLPDFISEVSDAGLLSGEQSIYETHTTIRSSESGTPAKQTSVRALAALFESQKVVSDGSPAKEEPQLAKSHVSTGSEGPNEDAETFKSIPPRIQCSPGRVSRDGGGKNGFHLTAFPAAEQNESQERGAGQPRLFKARGADMQTDETPKAMPSLGTIPPSLRTPTAIPQPELRRPVLSTATVAYTGSSAPLKSKGSACIVSTIDLQAQIQNLERFLQDQTEEAAELRKKLEAQENIHLKILNDQVGSIRKELRMWKERAEAAERKTRMFDRFTTRLRGIQSSIAAESSLRSSGKLPEEWRAELESKPGEATEGTFHIPRVRFAETSGIVRRGAEGTLSDDSGILEDGRLVPATIQDCLHRNSGKYRRPLDSAPAAPRELHFMDGVASPRDDDRTPNLGLAAVDTWIAAQELLRMEDEEAFRVGWTPLAVGNADGVDDVGLGDG